MRYTICAILVLLILLTACAPEPVPEPPAENGGGGCFCTMEYAPVCGVDGNTYSNACMAGCQNVEIDHEGEC